MGSYSEKARLDSILAFFFFLLFLETEFLCVALAGCPGTRSVGQAGLEQRPEGLCL